MKGQQNIRSEAQIIVTEKWGSGDDSLKTAVFVMNGEGLLSKPTDEP